jgi:hypothetical protein
MLCVEEGGMTQVPEPTEDRTAQTGALELDTEGHSLSNGEFTNAVLRDRRREDERYALEAARGRELKKPGRSLRRRLLGR